ncbi:MAG: hypothetical protein Q8928_02330 [Bacteroidota bacterium]|nr:hypothetical protein [Bacteroidota bacterium]
MKKIRSFNLNWVIGLSFMLVLSLPSCMKDEINLDKISNSVSLNPQFGAPVAYGSLSLKDLVDAVDTGGYIQADQNGLLTLSYRQQILSQSAASLFPGIPSVSFSKSITLGTVGYPIPPNTGTTLQMKDTLNFTIQNGVQLDSALIKSGIMSFTISSQFKDPGTITITFPTVLQNKTAFTYSVNFTGTGSFSSSGTKGLTGYTIGLIKKKNIANRLPYVITVNFSNISNLLSGQYIQTSIQINNPAYKAIYGNMSNTSLLDNSGELELKLFQNATFSGVKFKNPQLYFYINNSFGIPAQLSLSNTRIYSDNTNFTNLTLTGNPFSITPPALNVIGSFAQTTIKLDTINSNLRDAMVTTPKKLSYKVSATSGYTGTTPPTPNFVLDNSKFNVDVECKLPFDLKAQNLTLWDTTAMDLGSTLNDFSIIDTIILYNTFANSIPFSLKLQIYLADNNKNIVDTLYPDNTTIIDAGNPNTGAKANQTTKVIFNATRAKNLQKVKYAFIKATVATWNGGQTYVKLTSALRLDVAFQIQAKLKIKSLNQL